MGGVDRSDQMISYTNNVVKSFKWWKNGFLENNTLGWFGLICGVKCHFQQYFSNILISWRSVLLVTGVKLIVVTAVTTITTWRR